MTIQDVINSSKKLLTEKEAATYLGIAPGTLSVWRSTKRYPLPFKRIGRCIRYAIDDLDAFIVNGTVQ